MFVGGNEKRCEGDQSIIGDILSFKPRTLLLTYGDHFLT